MAVETASMLELLELVDAFTPLVNPNEEQALLAEYATQLAQLKEQSSRQLADGKALIKALTQTEDSLQSLGNGKESDFRAEVETLEELKYTAAKEYASMEAHQAALYEEKSCVQEAINALTTEKAALIATPPVVVPSRIA